MTRNKVGSKALGGLGWYFMPYQMKKTAVDSKTVKIDHTDMFPTTVNTDKERKEAVSSKISDTGKFA